MIKRKTGEPADQRRASHRAAAFAKGCDGQGRKGDEGEDQGIVHLARLWCGLIFDNARTARNIVKSELIDRDELCGAGCFQRLCTASSAALS